MGTFLRSANRPWLLAFGCLILTPVVLGVESSDYLESLKDDEEPLGPKEAVTEYPNGVNVIPGEADIHYPIYAKIPKSSFNCFGRRPGFYANTDLRCQVWHICDESGVQQDFLCTNGTIYSQDKRVCDWWYNVNCDPEEVSRNYEQNEELYKGPPPKKNTERDEEESNDLPPPPPRKSASPPQPQQRRPQQQPPRQQEFQRNEPQQQPRQEVQPTARRIGNDERPYTVEDRNAEQVQSRPPPSSRPAGSPPPSGTPEKKRVIVLRLPGPLPPGATIPPHILMEYAESVLAAERSGKAPPTGLHDFRNSQNSNRHQPSQQQRPRPQPTTTTQAPPPPPPQQPVAQAPRVSKPFTPVLPYTPRPFSTFLEAASKFNGQTKTQPRGDGEQNYNRPAQTPPPTQRPTQPPTPPTQRTTQQQQNYNRVQEQNNFRSSQAPQRPTADPQNYEREQQQQSNQRPQEQPQRPVQEQQSNQRPQEQPQRPVQEQQSNQRPQEQPQRPVQEQQNFKQSQALPQSPQTSTDTPYCDPESGQYCGEAVYERQREERLQQQQRQQSQRPQQRPQEEPRQQPPRPQERPQQRSQEDTRQQSPRPQERPQQRPQEDQRQQQRQNEEQRQQPQRPQERPQQQQRPQEDSRQQQQQRQQHGEQRQQSQRPQERPQERPREEPRQQQQQGQQYEEPRQQPQRPQERPQQRPQEEPRDQQPNYERPQEQEYLQRPQQQQSRPTSRPTPPPLDDAPLPEKKVPAKSPSSKSHAAPESSQKKFRHSTPRKIANVKFAPKSQALLEEEDGGFVVEESRRPAYPFQFNAYQQQPSVPEPQQQTTSGEKESVHLKSVVNPFQEKPRRQKHRPQQQQPDYTPEVAPTRAPEEATTVRRLVVVAKTLKIKDPRQQEARPVVPEVPFTGDFPREAYEAIKIGSNYRGTTEAPATFRTVARPTTTTTRRPSPPSTTTTTTTTTTEATTPEQVETQFSTVLPARRIIKKKKLRPITTTTTEHYDGQYVTNEPEHFFPSTESSAFSKITEDLGLDIYGRSPDDDEEEELIRAAQLYLQASESYGKRKRL